MEGLIRYSDVILKIYNTIFLKIYKLLSNGIIKYSQWNEVGTFIHISLFVLLSFVYIYIYVTDLPFFFFEGRLVFTTRQGVWICQVNSSATSRRNWKSCRWSSATCSTSCSCRKKWWTEEIWTCEFLVYVPQADYKMIKKILLNLDISPIVF